MNSVVPALKRALGLALLVAVSAAFPGLTVHAQPAEGSSGPYKLYLTMVDPPPAVLPPQSPEQIAYSTICMTKSTASSPLISITRRSTTTST